MDYDKVLTMLQVAREAWGYPQLKDLHDTVMHELVELSKKKETHEENARTPRPTPPSSSFRRET